MPVSTSNKLPVACFAPPLSDEIISSYKSTIASLDVSPLKDALEKCLACVELWWNLPESKPKPDSERFRVQHNGKIVSPLVTLLDAEHQKTLFDAIPWDYELDAIQKQFDNLVDINVRNMAFHLLWYARELCLDREPLTQEILM